MTCVGCKSRGCCTCACVCRRRRRPSQAISTGNYGIDTRTFLAVKFTAVTEIHTGYHPKKKKRINGYGSKQSKGLDSIRLKGCFTLARASELEPAACPIPPGTAPPTTGRCLKYVPVYLVNSEVTQIVFMPVVFSGYNSIHRGGNGRSAR